MRRKPFPCIVCSCPDGPAHVGAIGAIAFIHEYGLETVLGGLCDRHTSMEAGSPIAGSSSIIDKLRRDRGPRVPS